MKRALIVEDTPDLRELLQIELSDATYETVFAEDGPQAIALVQAAIEEGRPFDFMLVDIELPGFNGYVVSEKIFAMQPHAQVVLTTAYNLEDVSARGRNSGAAELWFKPYSMKKIKRRIGCAMGA